MRVLAIDPSINNIGWAIAHDGKLINWGLIKTKGKIDAEKLCDIEYKIKMIYMIQDFDRVYIEDLYRFIRKNNLTGKNKNVASILKLAKAYGMIEKTILDFGFITHKVSSKLARKTMAIKSASNYTKKKLTSHEAEAIIWAVFYSRMKGD